MWILIIRPDTRLFLIFTFLVFALNIKFPWIHLECLIKVEISECAHISKFWNTINAEKPVAKNSWLSSISLKSTINNPNPQSVLNSPGPEKCPCLQQIYLQAQRPQPEKDKVAAVTRHCCQECVMSDQYLTGILLLYPSKGLTNKNVPPTTPQWPMSLLI